MPDIRIRRDHTLGLARARQVAHQWGSQPNNGFALQGRVTTGDDRDVVHFSRSGVDGTLVIAADHYEITAALGFLLAAFRPMVEAEIGRNLDALMASAAAPPAQSTT